MFKSIRKRIVKNKLLFYINGLKCLHDSIDDICENFNEWTYIDIFDRNFNKFDDYFSRNTRLYDIRKKFYSLYENMSRYCSKISYILSHSHRNLFPEIEPSIKALETYIKLNEPIMWEYDFNNLYLSRYQNEILLMRCVYNIRNTVKIYNDIIEGQNMEYFGLDEDAYYKLRRDYNDYGYGDSREKRLGYLKDSPFRPLSLLYFEVDCLVREKIKTVTDIIKSSKMEPYSETIDTLYEEYSKLNGSIESLYNDSKELTDYINGYIEYIDTIKIIL